MSSRLPAGLLIALIALPGGACIAESAATTPAPTADDAYPWQRLTAVRH